MPKPLNKNNGYVGLIALMVVVVIVIIMMMKQYQGVGIIPVTKTENGKTVQTITPIEKAKDIKNVLEEQDRNLLNR